MTAGSVHVFIDMPAAVAYQLKALALSADPRFRQLGIASLRITGDTLFIHTTSGALDPSPKPNPIQAFFSSLFGKIVGIFLVILILLGLTTFLPQQRTPSASDPTATWSATPSIPTLTETPSATATQTPVEASAPTTATPTSTPIVYQTLNAVVANELSACNYGPGDLYLNNEVLRTGVRLQVFGTDINSGWAYVLADGFSEPCWVNLNTITLEGELENLKPVYPGEVILPPSDYWPPPQNVYSARSKSDPNKLSIYWDEFILQPGDMESADAPRYLLELWLCKGGELVFTPIFAWNNNVVVEDEAGCAEPSSGVIYISEKHGYPGPVVIPWDPHP